MWPTLYYSIFTKVVYLGVLYAVIMQKYGKRPPGSDGSDHIHREKVASQYKESAANKRKLRVLLGIPFLSCSVLLCHVLQVVFGFKLTNQVLPPVELWEYAYLMTVVLSVIGWMCLKKNRADLMLFYVMASSVLSVGSLIVAAVNHVSDLSLLLASRQTRMFLFGKPFPIILYGFIILSGLINTQAIYIASKLVQAWNTKGHKIK